MEELVVLVPFQYRKRYEITCDKKSVIISVFLLKFQYRKRYEITCDELVEDGTIHMTMEFQYRKRYEITCDMTIGHLPMG